MTACEKGVYISLLVHQFVNGCVPEGFDRMARIAGCDEDALRAAWEASVGEKFVLGPDGWINERMDEERSKSARLSASRSAAGRKGASSKWGKKGGTANGKARGGANSTQNQNQNQPSNTSKGVILDALCCHPKVLSAAKRWQEYRTEAKLKPWTAATWKRQLTKAEVNPDAFEEAVEFSISQGYQGLFAPRELHHKKRRPDGMTPALNALKEWHDEN